MRDEAEARLLFVFRAICFDQLQSDGIDAVAQTGGLRTVIEYVSEMRTATGAQDLGPLDK